MAHVRQSRPDSGRFGSANRNGLDEEYPRPALQRRLPSRFAQSDRVDGHSLEGHRLNRHHLDGHRYRQTMAHIRQSRTY